MGKPEQGDGATGGAGGGSGKYLPVLWGAVVLALVAAAGALIGMMLLDARRQDRVDELSGQLIELRQLVDQIQIQLDWHEEKLNTTLHAKAPARVVPEQDVVYEEAYDYDSDDGSYEYDNEEDEQNSKMTVKRTAILGQSMPSNSSETLLKEPVRSRRDVREERYVPSTPELRHFVDSRRKSEGLRIYASYFGKALADSVNIGPTGQNSRMKYSQTDSDRAPPVERTAAHHKVQPYAHLRHHPPVYQEQRMPEDTIVRLRHGGKNRDADMSDVELVTENFSGEYLRPQKQNHNLLAAHFVGDTSTYNTRDHPHYIGNGIMYHPEGLFKNWLPAPWMLELDTSSQFLMHNGKIKIENPGIYFVYAQVYYAATHDRSGFHVKHNGIEVAQCINTSSGRMVKRNTCFTATVLHLRQSDLLWLSEIEGHRNTSFKGSHSFFGLIQLRHIPT